LPADPSPPPKLPLAASTFGISIPENIDAAMMQAIMMDIILFELISSTPYLRLKAYSGSCPYHYLSTLK
jgi:hypothetical protein